MKPKLKLYLSVKNMDGVFGDGKWILLRSIRDQGCIQQAAKKLNRGYRKAWGDIRKAEKGLGRPLVLKTRGGTGGGKTELTLLGNELVYVWEKFRKDVSKSMEQAYKRHLVSVLKRSGVNIK